MQSLERESPIAVLSWVARAKAIAAKGYHDEAAAWMAANRAPEKAQRIFKSPAGAGSTIDSDLGDYGISIGAWSDSMRTQSAFYRILNDNGFTRVPIRTRVGITTVPVTGSVVGEGAAVPLSPLQLQNLMLQPVKAASLIVVTDELLRDISAAGQAALSRALMGAVSDAVDAAFLDAIVSTGTTSIGSSGATAVDAKADLRAALLAVNTVGAAKLYWIAAPDVAKRASTLDATGLDAFPAMSAMGGELANLPCIVSSSGVPAGSLYLVDASGIAADGGPVTVKVSTQGDVLMDTAPPMNATTPTPASLVSLWQTNSTGLLANAWLGAQVLRDDAVAVITGISWGG
jgi:HK97 family phage major capsid protein